MSRNEILSEILLIFLALATLVFLFGVIIEHPENWKNTCLDEFSKGEKSRFCSISYGSYFNSTREAAIKAQEAAIEAEARLKEKKEKLEKEGVTAEECAYGWVQKQEIYSLNINSKIEGTIQGSSHMGGTFLLGFGGVSGSGSISGSISQNMAYYFYTKTENDGFLLESANAMITELFETNNRSPSLEVFEKSDPRISLGRDVFAALRGEAEIRKVLPEEFEIYCFEPIVLDGWEWIGNEMIVRNLGKQRLVVPVGTVKQEFGVN